MRIDPSTLDLKEKVVFITVSITMLSKEILSTITLPSCHRAGLALQGSTWMGHKLLTMRRKSKWQN